MAESDSEFQDLIIIKRRANTDMETPKGGVWKIAFADFMTAMMCFFLVMWLINAANEDTRQAVASYFNPVRLAELNTKGLENPHIPPENQSKDGERTREEGTPGSAAPAEPSADISRDALFKDPYKVLSEIAAEAGPAAEGAGGDAGGPGVLRAEVTREFRDPFDPFFAENSNPAVAAEAESKPEILRPSLLSPSEESGNPPAGEAQMAELPHSMPEANPPSATPGAPVPMSPALDVPGQNAIVPWQPPAEEQSDSARRAELAAELTEAVRQETGSEKSPGVAVEQTGEGVMISLTDDADFGMFDIGSAEPRPQMVRIMERIAAILKSRTGQITIRGHTDARPFRTAAYDNWRLSTDRAQMAYYMLVRGGLNEQRVEAIEGYADRKLKVLSDPEAAENRRIEILLREVTL